MSSDQGRAGPAVVLVTGVSRTRGIGFAIAQRFLSEGYRVFVQSWAEHDARKSHASGERVEKTLEALGGEGEQLAHLELDLEDPHAPETLIERVVDLFGGVDVLVANHAHSSDQDLMHLTATELDRAWAVNTRATALLVRAFARRHDDARGAGRIVLMTSGQHLAPMASELPYAISKGAVQSMTASLADALADRAITVNAINPGPVDTGWASGELHDQIRASFPRGRWGTPEDIAPVVCWLASAEAGWITGQTINVEGGFRRG